MKNYWILITIVLFLGGCAPKMGKDIIIEPSGHLRWENTKSEVMMGLLSLLGGPSDKEVIRIGTDVTIINRWHSAMKLKSFTYALADDKKTLATGSACVDAKGFTVEPNTQRSLGLLLEIDLHGVTMNQLIAIVQEKSKMTLSGEAVVEVWGLEYHYAFSKDATLLISKALNARKSKGA